MCLFKLLSLWEISDWVLKFKKCGVQELKKCCVDCSKNCTH